jgi:CHAT domain-containing protein
VESIGLAHAFLAAGAQVVIAAVRPVPDEEAAALMTAFYAELSRGAPAEEALRRAQLALRTGKRISTGFSFRAFVP